MSVRQTTTTANKKKRRKKIKPDIEVLAGFTGASIEEIEKIIKKKTSSKKTKTAGGNDQQPFMLTNMKELSERIREKIFIAMNSVADKYVFVTEDMEKLPIDKKDPLYHSRQVPRVPLAITIATFMPDGGAILIGGHGTAKSSILRHMGRIYGGESFEQIDQAVVEGNKELSKDEVVAEIDYAKFFGQGITRLFPSEFITGFWKRIDEVDELPVNIVHVLHRFLAEKKITYMQRTFGITTHRVFATLNPPRGGNTSFWELVPFIDRFPLIVPVKQPSLTSVYRIASRKNIEHPIHTTYSYLKKTLIENTHDDGENMDKENNKHKNIETKNSNNNHNTVTTTEIDEKNGQVSRENMGNKEHMSTDDEKHGSAHGTVTGDAENSNSVVSSEDREVTPFFTKEDVLLITKLIQTIPVTEDALELVSVFQRIYSTCIHADQQDKGLMFEPVSQSFCMMKECPYFEDGIDYPCKYTRQGLGARFTIHTISASKVIAFLSGHDKVEIKHVRIAMKYTLPHRIQPTDTIINMEGHQIFKISQKILDKGVKVFAEMKKALGEFMNTRNIALKPDIALRQIQQLSIPVAKEYEELAIKYNQEQDLAEAVAMTEYYASKNLVEILLFKDQLTQKQQNIYEYTLLINDIDTIAERKHYNQEKIVITTPQTLLKILQTATSKTSNKNKETKKRETSEENDLLLIEYPSTKIMNTEQLRKQLERITGKDTTQENNAETITSNEFYKEKKYIVKADGKITGLYSVSITMANKIRQLVALTKNHQDTETTEHTKPTPLIVIQELIEGQK